MFTGRLSLIVACVIFSQAPEMVVGNRVTLVEHFADTFADTTQVADAEAAAAQTTQKVDTDEEAARAEAEFIASLDVEKCQISGTGGRQLSIGRQLGHGMEGVVYAGMENGKDAAAVKIMKSVNQKELRNLKKLTSVHSQHLLHIEAGFENVQNCCGKPCVITQLINGKDMADILSDNGIKNMKAVTAGKARKGAVSYQLLRSLILQALVAFRDTEKAGLCNSDQHLRNVMYEQSTERVVFIDFGEYVRDLGRGGGCAPSNFESDEVMARQVSPNVQLQSWQSLAYLLEDPNDAQAYIALCNRVGRYPSAAAALTREAFATPDMDPTKPGQFFALHPDDIITQQLEALKSTGSPHLGQPTAKSPFEAGAARPGVAGRPQQPAVARRPQQPAEAPPAKAGCVMTFEEDGKPVDITITSGPFGMTYDDDAFPITIVRLRPGGNAEAAGVKVGMKLTKIDGVDLIDFVQAEKLIKDTVKSLPVAQPRVPQPGAQGEQCPSYCKNSCWFNGSCFKNSAYANPGNCASRHKGSWCQ